MRGFSKPDSILVFSANMVGELAFSWLSGIA